MDLLVMNEHEAADLTGIKIDYQSDMEEISKKLNDMSIHKSIITLGSKGAVVIDNEHIQSIMGEKIKAVDTQGAGDAFAGILMGTLSKGAGLIEAAQRANHIAAKCVEIQGSTIISLDHLKGQ